MLNTIIMLAAMGSFWEILKEIFAWALTLFVLVVLAAPWIAGVVIVYAILWKAMANMGNDDFWK